MNKFLNLWDNSNSLVFDLSFLRKWFKNDQKSLDRLKDCSAVPYTASVQNTFDYINILRSGHVNWWPKGVFEESFDEVLAITEANNAN